MWSWILGFTKNRIKNQTLLMFPSHIRIAKHLLSHSPCSCCRCCCSWWSCCCYTIAAAGRYCYCWLMLLGASTALLLLPLLAAIVKASPLPCCGVMIKRKCHLEKSGRRCRLPRWVTTLVSWVTTHSFHQKILRRGKSTYIISQELVTSRRLTKKLVWVTTR